MELLPATRLLALRPEGLEVVANVSDTVPDPTTVWRPVLPRNIRNPFAMRPKISEHRRTLPAEMVVFAVGVRPRDGLFRDCVGQAAAGSLYNIGDSFSVGRVLDATRAGHATAAGL